MLPFQIDLSGKVAVITGAGGVLCSGGVVIEELWDGAADALDIDAMEQTAAAYIRTSDAMIETDYYRRED